MNRNTRGVEPAKLAGMRNTEVPFKNPQVPQVIGFTMQSAPT